jgi:hypothetical protein
MTGGGTNEKVTTHLPECLSLGCDVSVWAWKPTETIDIAGLRVDPVKGLENPLIDRFRPERKWNQNYGAG